MVLFNSLVWNKAKGNDSVFDEAIEKLMIPYKINFDMFLVNMDCFVSRQGYSYKCKKNCSHTMYYFCEAIPAYDLPLGFPEWFYSAFPDVAYWMIERNGYEMIKSEHPEISSLSNNELTDSTGRLRVTILKEIIDCYLKNISNKLELRN